jgi:hypothetical protein
MGLHSMLDTVVDIILGVSGSLLSSHRVSLAKAFMIQWKKQEIWGQLYTVLRATLTSVTCNGVCVTEAF